MLANEKDIEKGRHPNGCRPFFLHGFADRYAVMEPAMRMSTSKPRMA